MQSRFEDFLQVRRLQKHGLRLALHRHLVPPLGRVEAPRHAAPPVELGPPLEAVDAHVAALMATGALTELEGQIQIPEGGDHGG